MFCTSIQIGRSSVVMRIAMSAVGGMNSQLSSASLTSTLIISDSDATSSTATYTKRMAPRLTNIRMPSTSCVARCITWPVCALSWYAKLSRCRWS